MATFSIEDFEGKVDSLYRLIIIGARRANQLSRAEARRFGRSKQKTTTMALQEILEGKVTYQTGDSDEEDLFE